MAWSRSKSRWSHSLPADDLGRPGGVLLAVAHHARLAAAVLGYRGGGGRWGGGAWGGEGENQRLIRAPAGGAGAAPARRHHDSRTGAWPTGPCPRPLAAALETGPATVIIVDLDDFKTVQRLARPQHRRRLLVGWPRAADAVGGGRPAGHGAAGTSSRSWSATPGRRHRRADQRIGEVLDGLASASTACSSTPAPARHRRAPAPAGPPVRDANRPVHGKQRGKANWVRSSPDENAGGRHDQLGAELRRALEPASQRSSTSRWSTCTATR